MSDDSFTKQTVYKPYRYKGWLRQAYFDLEAAKLSYNNAFFEWTCFQAEQSAEKALKAIIAYSGVKPPKLHKLSLLYHFARQQNKEVGKIRLNMEILQAYTFISRYPFLIPGDNMSPHDFITQKNADECIREANTVLLAVGNILKYTFNGGPEI